MNSGQKGRTAEFPRPICYSSEAVWQLGGRLCTTTARAECTDFHQSTCPATTRIAATCSSTLSVRATRIPCAWSSPPHITGRSIRCGEVASTNQGQKGRKNSRRSPHPLEKKRRSPLRPHHAVKQRSLWRKQSHFRPNLSPPGPGQVPAGPSRFEPRRIKENRLADEFPPARRAQGIRGFATAVGSGIAPVRENSNHGGVSSSWPVYQLSSRRCFPTQCTARGGLQRPLTGHYSTP